MPPQGQGAAAAVAAAGEAPRKEAKKRRLDKAVKEFERQHGPLAMRTADTPKQAKMRPKRQAQRLAREQARVFFENRDYGPTSGGCAFAHARGADPWLEHVPPAGGTSTTPEIARPTGLAAAEPATRCRRRLGRIPGRSRGHAEDLLRLGGADSIPVHYGQHGDETLTLHEDTPGLVGGSVPRCRGIFAARSGWARSPSTRCRSSRSAKTHSARLQQQERRNVDGRGTAGAIG